MESLANQYNIDGTVNPLVIGICILLILLGIVKLADYLDDRKQTQCDDLMSGHVVYELHPPKEQLTAIVNHKRFKQTPDKFQDAVLGKLKAYDMDPSAIEATMSAEQLYEAGSPLWTKGLSIEAIYLFAYLVPIMTSENVPLTNYMDDYVRDCKNSMNPTVARDIQLEKYGI